MKKLLCLLLVAVLVLSVGTSCGKRASGGGETTSGNPSVSAEPTPEPTPEPPPYTPSLLTGLPYEGDYPKTERFAAVMINNISNNALHDIRPQASLSQADILVEIKVEGGITRFMGLFSDYKTLPEKIGPIRSARDQFFQIFLPFQPLFVHIGESFKQKEYCKIYNYFDMDLNLDNYANSSYRDSALQSRGVATWEIAFSSGETIRNLIDSNGKDTQRTYNSTFFNFVNYNEPERELTGDADGNNFDAQKIDIVHSEGYRTYFNYNEADKRYMMSQYSMAKRGVHDTTDANNGEQLGFKNVIVVFTDIHAYPGHEEKDLQYVDLGSGGFGYYFSNGRAEQVRWVKGAPEQVLRIVDKNGNDTDVQINPGKTYLAVVDLDECKRFAYYPTEAAAEGSDNVEVNEDVADTGIVAE